MIITVVGAGALGSHLVQFIRNEKATIRIVDFDRVEQRNVLSQFHGKPSVGKFKVESLKQMQFLYGVKIETISHKLVDNNVEAILGKHRDDHLIIDCLDNGASRRLVQAHVRAHGLPCLHGGLAADGSFGCVIWDESFTVDDEPSAGAATCENGEFLPFIALVSACLAYSVQRFLQNGRKISFHVTPAGVVKL